MSYEYYGNSAVGDSEPEKDTAPEFVGIKLTEHGYIIFDWRNDEDVFMPLETQSEAVAICIERDYEYREHNPYQTEPETTPWLNADGSHELPF